MGNEITPTFFRHLQTVYDAMDEAAEVRTFDDVEYRTFIGPLVELYDGLGLSRANYSSIFSTLIDNGYVTKLQQGTRGYGSVIVLHSRPSENDFAARRGKHLTDQQDGDTLVRRVERLEKRLGGLDIVEALANIENRLKVVEKGEKASGKTAS